MARALPFVLASAALLGVLCADPTARALEDVLLTRLRYEVDKEARGYVHNSGGAYACRSGWPQGGALSVP